LTFDLDQNLNIPTQWTIEGVHHRSLNMFHETEEGKDIVARWQRSNSAASYLGISFTDLMSRPNIPLEIFAIEALRQVPPSWQSFFQVDAKHAYLLT
jgi:hypothetical protein